MKIGIDFDRTLFDTDSFKEHLEDRFPGFSSTYSQSKENDVYRPRRHAELLDVELEEIFDEMQECSRFLYSDIESLEKLREDGHQLFLISRGEEEIQRLKIKGSDVQRFFEKTAVISESIEELSKDSVFDIDLLVDDRREELKAVNVPALKSNPDVKSVESMVEKVRKRLD